MLTFIRSVGIIAAIIVMVMICRSPDAKENFKEDHYKSLIIAIGPMVAFVVLVYIALAQIG